MSCGSPSTPNPITSACLSLICQTEGLRLLRGFHPSAGGPQTPAWPHTPESLQKEEEWMRLWVTRFLYQFLSLFKTKKCDCSFIFLLSYCKRVCLCMYLVAVVGTQGWGMLPIKLLRPRLGSQSTRLQPTEGSLESSLSCDKTHAYCLNHFYRYWSLSNAHSLHLIAWNFCYNASTFCSTLHTSYCAVSYRLCFKSFPIYYHICLLFYSGVQCNVLYYMQ